MMTDYEKLFTDMVYTKLREGIKGKVTVYIDNDILYVKLYMGKTNFNMEFEDFANGLITGRITSNIVANLVFIKYRKFINNIYFK